MVSLLACLRGRAKQRAEGRKGASERERPWQVRESEGATTQQPRATTGPRCSCARLAHPIPIPIPTHPSIRPSIHRPRAFLLAFESCSSLCCCCCCKYTTINWNACHSRPKKYQTDRHTIERETIGCDDMFHSLTQINTADDLDSTNQREIDRSRTSTRSEATPSSLHRCQCLES